MSPILTKFLALLLIISGISTMTGCKSASDQGTTNEKVSDIEGNSYTTIQIGKQVWMAENLKTTTFSDGSPISEIENYDEWASLTLPAYSWYNNDSINTEDFGALYNYYAVETEKLCPEGWHVPTDEEWIELETSLEGAGTAGGAMKEAGMAHWKTPNTRADNESGFTALPGGYRSYNGTFNLMRTDGYLWSSSEKNWYGTKNTVIYRNLKYDDQSIYRRIAEKANGFSVRCVKNP